MAPEFTSNTISYILLNNCQAFFTNKIYVNLYKLIVVYIKEDSFVYIITKESYKTISYQC